MPSKVRIIFHWHGAGTFRGKKVEEVFRSIAADYKISLPKPNGPRWKRVLALYEALRATVPKFSTNPFLIIRETKGLGFGKSFYKQLLTKHFGTSLPKATVKKKLFGNSLLQSLPTSAFKQYKFSSSVNPDAVVLPKPLSAVVYGQPAQASWYSVDINASSPHDPNEPNQP